MTGNRENAIAVFGGAFDPPHLTHRRIADASLVQLPIDAVVVLPAGDHPHKPKGRITKAIDRLTMCKIGFAMMPRIRVDDREVRRRGPAFTVDTLQGFLAEQPGRALYFLIGSDNLPLLPSWQDHHEILRLCTVATFPRQGHAIGPAILEGLDLTPGEREKLMAHVLAIEPDAVSATDIRKRLRGGERGLPELLPTVEQYAVRYRLYAR